MSLLNVDYKIISKMFASRLKKVIPNLISSQQTAYVAQSFIDKSGRLISDLLSATKNEGKRVFSDSLVTKTFDTVDHTFLISTLEKFAT